MRRRAFLAFTGTIAAIIADIDLTPTNCRVGHLAGLDPSASPIRIKTKRLKRAVGENDRIALALLSEDNNALRDDFIDHGRTPVSIMQLASRKIIGRAKRFDAFRVESRGAE